MDSLLDSRATLSTRASRLEMINEFMAEWDGIKGANKNVIVMGATNRPSALDDAVLRRFPRRLLVDLPDAAGRREILALMLKDDRLSADVNLDAIADSLVNYSGSDIKNVCMAAAMSSLRRHRSLLERRDAAPGAALDAMEISQADFTAATRDVAASISEAMGTLHDLRAWDETFGEGKRAPARKVLGFN